MGLPNKPIGELKAVRDPEVEKRERARSRGHSSDPWRFKQNPRA